jgi:hypothetical protein
MMYARGLIVIGGSTRDAIEDKQMETLARRLLNTVEPMLERKPSSLGLWQQWLFWREIGSADRPFEDLLNRVKLSPLSTTTGTVLPTTVMESYYQECRKNSDWPKLLKLLVPIWERESFRIDRHLRETPDKDLPYSRLGDSLVVPSMEAYLHEGKFLDANDTFNYRLNSDGKFTDFSQIVELAKEMGQERYAREWEERVKK